MEITYDRASKFYEPGEKVTGTMVVKEWANKFSDLRKLEVNAESYMDTVSQIRGAMGRPPLEVDKRTYFMKKKVEINDVPGEKAKKTFSFVLESTEVGEKLIDAYVGVEFSIVVSIFGLD